MNGWNVSWACDLESCSPTISEPIGETSCFVSVRTSVAGEIVPQWPLLATSSAARFLRRWQWWRSDWNATDSRHTRTHVLQLSFLWYTRVTSSALVRHPLPHSRGAENRVFYSHALYSFFVRVSLLCDKLDSHRDPHLTRLTDSQTALFWCVAWSLESSEPEVLINLCKVFIYFDFS